MYINDALIDTDGWLCNSVGRKWVEHPFFWTLQLAFYRILFNSLFLYHMLLSFPSLHPFQQCIRREEFKNTLCVNKQMHIGMTWTRHTYIIAVVHWWEKIKKGIFLCYFNSNRDEMKKDLLWFLSIYNLWVWSVEL